MDALKSKGQMYDQINLGSIPKSGFDLSYNCKGTGTLGRLYPTRCEEVLPGDKWQGSSQVAVQFEPLAVPMLSNMYIKQETFKVPARILWTNWEKFITGGEKLDYDGVVPSVSLKDICDAVSNFFFTKPPVAGSTGAIYRLGISSVVSDVFSVADVDNNRLPVFFVGDTISKLDSVRKNVISRSEKLQCLDLIQPSISALDSAIKWLKDYQAYMLALPKTTSFGRFVYNMDNTDKVFIPLWRIVEGDISGKYTVLYSFDSVDRWQDLDMKAIAPMLDAYDDSHTSPHNVAELSTDALTLLRYIYDIYKPFVGKSSVIDYLGYGKITFRDMLADFLDSLVTSGIPSSCDSGFSGYTPMLIFFFGSMSGAPLSVLPLRANYMIWYWYYRDQILETDALEPIDTDDVTTNELLALLMPRVRCWSKDTFTTALTNTGTGSMVVNVSQPVDSSVAPKRLDAFMNDTIKDYDSAKLQDMDLVSYTLTDGTKVELPTRYLQGAQGVKTGTADLSSNGFSLDMLNRAQRMQKWLMKALIFGNRPQDALFTHFGVKSSDARLRLPEFICGDTQMCKLDTVMNNTTTSESVAGDKSGNAYGYQDGNNLNTFCEEHGFIISIMSIMPETEYGFGSKRLLRKLNKFDFAFPEFAQLGMDAVYEDELVRQPFLPRSATFKDFGLRDTKVFGYQGRYYDYKSRQNDLHGDLLDVKDMYTFARNFNVYAGEFPNLNYQFVHCHPRTDMFVTDDPSVDLFWFDCHFAQAVERCLPVPSQVF